MKNIKKITFTVIFVFIMLILAGGCDEAKESSSLSMHETAQTPVTYLLKSEPYKQKVALTGTLSADKKTFVSTKSPGRIANLFYNVGDIVKEGDLLGSLAGDESLINLDTAQLDEENATLVYESQKKLLIEQVESAKKTLERAETALEVAKQSSSDTKITAVEQIDLAEKSVSQAEIALEIAKTTANQRFESLYDTTISTIRTAVLVAANAHSFAENLLEVNESRTNSYYDKYKYYFGGLDSSTKRDARNALKISYALYKEIESKLDELEESDTNSEKHKEYIEDTLEMLEVTQDMLNKAYVMLNNSITATILPETSLQSFRQEALTYSQSIQEAILSASGSTKIGVKGWLVTYDEIVTQNNAEINAAQSQLLIAQQQLNQSEASASQYISSSENQIFLLEKDVEQAQIALFAAEAQKQNVLRQLERELSVVRGTAELSEVFMSNTRVLAPFDGIITGKFVEEGQVVAAGQPIFELSNTAGFKIETDLPDTYIAKLKTDLLAEVSIDGFDGVYNAEVTQIDPNVNPANHKLGIELTLLEFPSNAKIGQFARINLLLPEETVYFVPTNFIYRDFEGAYIVLQNGDKQAISIGFEKNGMVQIWWPEIGENIVITR